MARSSHRRVRWPMGVALGVMLFLAMSLLAVGCGGGSATEDSGYREEERALLQIAADSVVELELKKDYATLYDTHTSKAFQRRMPPRDFLRLTNCVETHLGGFLSYDRKSLAFRRQRPRHPGGVPHDRLRLRVFRETGLMVEDMVFVPEGLSFKLESLRWLSPRTEFLDCVRSLFPASAQAPLPADGDLSSPGSSDTPTPSAPQAASGTPLPPAVEARPAASD